MSIITDTATLTAFCARAATFKYITVDTEFIREKTYWPKLCLVQLGTSSDAVVIDVLSDEIDLAPLFQLLSNNHVLKVFHAARQDIEIFVHLYGEVPHPIFDTQIAAMVCGYGDAVSYERLVRDLTNQNIDKSMRYTDWAKRPLSKKQIDYALGDVTYLHEVYSRLSAMLNENKRVDWLSEEMNILTNSETYLIKPEESWKRLKTRSKKPSYLANIREIAKWREETAQKLNIPRRRVLKDESLTEIAVQLPSSIDELKNLRVMKRDQIATEKIKEIIAVLDRVRTMDEKQYPQPSDKNQIKSDNRPSVELLKVLLKLKCDSHKVAQKLIASSSDIEELANNDDAQVPALQGWRLEVFGRDALRLKHGEIALTARGSQVRIIETQ